ncbi:hypothetical protein SH501x_001787 [Pirellulaceae bacterium SH501]
MSKFQISIRGMLFAFVVIALVLAAAIELNGRLEDLATNGYRVQTTGYLLVDYVDDFGKWPESWEDLQRHIEANRSTLKFAPDVTDLQSYVRIDFDFDPDRIDLKRGWFDEKPPFVVVESVYGRTAGATCNPNEFIYAYLRGDVLQSPLHANKKLQRVSR